MHTMEQWYISSDKKVSPKILAKNTLSSARLVSQEQESKTNPTNTLLSRAKYLSKGAPWK